MLLLPGNSIKLNSGKNMCTKYKGATEQTDLCAQENYDSEPVGLELQKCGEILLTEDGDEFILSCTFCMEIFFEYEQFLRHAHTLHNFYSHSPSAIDRPDCKWDDSFDSTIGTDKILGLPCYSVADEFNPMLGPEQGFKEAPLSRTDKELQSSEIAAKHEFPIINENNPARNIEFFLDDCLNFEDRKMDKPVTYKHFKDVSRTPCPFLQQNRYHRSSSKSLIRNRRLLWYFIGLYKEHPCLWRADHEHIADRTERYAAIEKISAAMHQRFRYQISTTKVIKTIRNIRACFLREYHRRTRRSDSTYKPKLWYYSKLSFLENAETYEDECGDKLKELIKAQKPKCENCQREFKTRHALVQHYRTFASCKPFRCEVCQKSFSSRKNLQAHLASHQPLSERRYTCEFCGLKIALQHNYLVHLRRHTKLYAHHCVICGKGVANSQELKYHRLDHTGERPNICEVCGLTFKTRSSMTRHRLQHEAEAIY